MGAFEFGIFTYGWIWVTVLGTLCALGFADSVVRFLPEYRERGEIDHFRGFLAAGRAVSPWRSASLAMASPVPLCS